jgi:hypothetical protein
MPDWSLRSSSRSVCAGVTVSADTARVVKKLFHLVVGSQGRFARRHFLEPRFELGSALQAIAQLLLDGSLYMQRVSTGMP